MKKLFFIIGLFFSLSAAAQPTNYTKINMRYRWLSGMFDSVLYVPRYNGTPSGVRVNETSVFDGMISMDTTNSRLYIYSGGSWVRLANYSEIAAYTAGNGLTLSGSQFKLGGTLTENTNVDSDVSGTRNMYFGVNTKLNNFAAFATGGVDIRQFSGGNYSQILIQDNAIQLNSVGSSKQSTIFILPDSISILPNTGKLNIDSLRTTTDTTVYKPLVWGDGGQVRSMTSWPGGGGITTAGNGLTLSGSQFKLGGTLTENTTIAANNYNLKIDSFGTIGFYGKSNNPDDVISKKSIYSVNTDDSGDDGLFLQSISNRNNSDFSHIRLSGGSTVIRSTQSIMINPNDSANLNIGFLQNGTINDYIMTLDSVDGKVRKINASAFQKVNLVFGAGSGADSDTTAFTTSAIYGSFFNDADTIVVTSMRSVLQGTSPDITYKVWYNDSLNVEAGATALVTAGSQVTNTTTGTNVTSFDVTKIPPGVWVWVKTSAVATKPKYFSLTINGYRK